MPRSKPTLFRQLSNEDLASKKQINHDSSVIELRAHLSDSYGVDKTTAQRLANQVSATHLYDMPSETIRIKNNPQLILSYLEQALSFKLTVSHSNSKVLRNDALRLIKQLATPSLDVIKILHRDNPKNPSLRDIHAGLSLLLTQDSKLTVFEGDFEDDRVVTTP